MNSETNPKEGKRLEDLWSGEFGNDYIKRNLDVARGREDYWRALLSNISLGSVLEVGCNVGANLKWISEYVPSENIYGIDVNANALQKCRESLPDANLVRSVAKSLPFRDSYFDLVFTAGVLIHQPEDTLLDVMNEIYRSSNQYVLAIEYYSQNTVEVPYRGQQGALFKRDYGTIYQENFPDLELVNRAEISESEGWDDNVSWLFRKKRTL